MIASGIALLGTSVLAAEKQKLAGAKSTTLWPTSVFSIPGALLRYQSPWFFGTRICLWCQPSYVTLSRPIMHPIDYGEPGNRYRLKNLHGVGCEGTTFARNLTLLLLCRAQYAPCGQRTRIGKNFGTHPCFKRCATETSKSAQNAMTRC